MKYTYPLHLRFKLLAFAPRITVKDAAGNELFYIEQKVFALKEAVKVFNNEKEKKLLYTMKANRVIDFSATYVIRDAKDKVLGSIHRDGMRSLFQATYTISDAEETPQMHLVQTNPLIALLDSLLNLIPFAGLLSGFILNPTYEIKDRQKKKTVLKMKKKPSFFEALYEITDFKEKLPHEDETLSLLSFLMIVQLERDRG